MTVHKKRKSPRSYAFSSQRNNLHSTYILQDSQPFLYLSSLSSSRYALTSHSVTNTSMVSKFIERPSKIVSGTAAHGRFALLRTTSPGFHAAVPRLDLLRVVEEI